MDGLPPIREMLSGGSDMVFHSILSQSWETVDQNFYTRLAQSVDPIDSTISFYADVLSSGNLRAFTKRGNEVTDKDPLVNLLNNPNDNQNFAQFIKEWCYYYYAHGWTYIHPTSRSVGFERVLDGNSQIVNLDPDNIAWRNEVSFFKFLNRSNNDVYFDYPPYNLKRVKYSDVIAFFDIRQNPEKPYMGISRLLSLRQQIENYNLSLQGKKNMILRSGSQLLSLDAKAADEMGLESEIGTGEFDENGVPVTTTHKKQLEDQIRSTGITAQNKGIIFSTLPLKVSSLSEGLDKIGFDKLAVEDARIILNKFNLPKEFQNLTTETAKFANRQMAMQELIQNTIEPLARSFCDKMMKFYGASNYIMIDFDHLPVFAENEMTKVATQQAVINLYLQLLQNNIIDEETFKQKLAENGIIDYQRQ